MDGNGIYSALVLSLGLSLVLSLIQLASDSKIYSIRCYWTHFFFLYFMVVSIGNLTSTLIACGVINKWFTDPKSTSAASTYLLQGPRWIWYSFFGVFGFETFMRRINITFLGKGLLTIDNWISKAKTGAVAGTIKKKADTDIFDAQVLANKLYKKYMGNRARIHTIANSKLGGQEYAAIIADFANKPAIDRELHLCYILADQFPLEMKGELMA